jgi:hypothetical protein
LKRGHVVTPSGYAWYCIASSANHDVVGLYASAAFGGEHRINATIEMLHRAGEMKQKRLQNNTSATMTICLVSYSCNTRTFNAVRRL